VKCHQRSRQVKHLQHYKAGFCLQYARGFHPLPTLETDQNFRLSSLVIFSDPRPFSLITSARISGEHLRARPTITLLIPL
jgi:hypothetical protein